MGRVRQFVPVALVIAVLVGIPLLGAVVTGSMEIPHNDAWSHAKIAQVFAQTGEIRLLDWNRAALIGQIVVLGPLGASIVAQQLFVALLAVVGLAATYALLLPRIGPRLSLLALVCIGATAEFALLSTSFMTDVPTFALMVSSLAFLDQAMRRTSLWWYLAALVVAMWATTIRDQALAAVLAVVVVAAWTWRGRLRGIAVILGVVGLGLITVFELWRRALPHGDAPGISFTPGLAAKSGLLAILAIGLYLLPLLIAVVRPREWTSWGITAAGGALLVASGWIVLRWDDALFGNYLTRHGSYPTANFELGTHYTMSGWLWTLLLVMTVVGVTLGTGHVVSRGLHLDRVTAVYGVLVALMTFGPTMLSQEIFARGLLPLLPIVILMVEVSPPSSVTRRRWAVAGVAVVILAATALSLTLHALAFDAARWQFAESLVARGWAPGAVDAGIEWDGWHATGPYRPGGDNAPCGPLGADRPRLIVTPDGHAGPPPIATWSYPTFGVVGDSVLAAYPDPACGA